MAQNTTGDFNLDPTTVNGVELANRLNRLFAAIVSTQEGSARPAYLAEGGLWVKNAAGGLELYLYDGANDILLHSLAGPVATRPAGIGNGGLWVKAGAVPTLMVFDGTNDHPVGSMAAASAAEVLAGLIDTKAVTPKGLESRILAAPSSAGGTADPADANYLVVLNGNGQIDSNFLDVAVDLASKAEAIADPIAGAAHDHLISAGVLREIALQAPTGPAGAATSNDEHYLVRLDATGKIAANFLPVSGGIEFKGNVDVTGGGTVPTGDKAGDFHMIGQDGNVNAAWTAAIVQAPNHVKAGDMVLFDGANYHHLAGSMDPTGFMQLDGAQNLGPAFAITAPAGMAADHIIIDGRSRARAGIARVTLDRSEIDAGTY